MSFSRSATEASRTPARGRAGDAADVGSPLATWGRRAVTVPMFTALCVLGVLTAPFVFPIAAIVDLLRGRPLPTVRCLAFFLYYLACEVLGIAASFALWLVRGPWTGRDRSAYLRANFALQCWWARSLYGGADAFRMRTTIEGEEAVSHGPIIYFSRHASVGDTLLAAVFISNRHHLVLRYVLKRELLWDPCLDIVGNRTRNCFVQRGSGDSQREVAAIQELMTDLGPNEGVLIYPEGTRFTPAKQKRIRRRLKASSDRRAAKEAEALRCVLPPRLGGAIGLLEANRNADAVFCAHVGFEGANTFHHLLDGSLVDQRIHVRFWRVPFREIPVDRVARREWLYAQWRRIDDWVAAQLAADRD